MKTQPQPDPRPATHEMIRASAGAGKTFQLTNRFLKLVLDGEDPSSILASTFTRAAAGEILERTLVRLARAAQDAPQSDALGKQLGLASLPPELVRRRLRELVDSLHRVQVQTLDAMFVRMVTVAGLEAGLPPHWSILDEADAHVLTETALEQVIEHEGRSLIPLLRLLDKGRSSRSVMQQLRGVTRELHDLYVESDASAWRQLDPLPRLDAGQMQSALAVLAQVPPGAKMAVRNSLATDHRRASRGHWTKFVSSGIAAKVADGESRYRGFALPAPWVNAYQRLLDHARAVLRAELADQTESTATLLASYDHHLQALKLQRGQLGFADLARFLSNLRLMDDLTPLFVRMDTRVRHLLLDEFQDTARAQWNVLAPLAREITSHSDEHTSLFCVGDTKQAIYGWRGGEAGIFESLERQLGLTRRDLQTNWRSAPVVLEFVNQVFTNLSRNPAIAGLSDVDFEWEFTPHVAARAHASGYVRVETANDAEGAEGCLMRAAERVAQVARQMPNASTAVLVRTNAAANHMKHLLRRQGVRVSDEAGSPLADSAAAEIILSLFTLLDHPGDTVALARILDSPLADVVGSTAETTTNLRALRQERLGIGSGPLIERWAQRLAPHCSPGDRRRLEQLAQLGFESDRRPSLRSDDFVRAARVAASSEPAADAVRVLTIHRAKGLEFDVVFLPELRQELVGHHQARVLVDRPTPLAPPSWITRTPSPALRRVDPSFDGARRRMRGQELRESLSLLYVALTRARHAIHVILEPSAANERKLPARLGSLVRGAMVGDTKVPANAVLFEAGAYDGPKDPGPTVAAPTPDRPPRLQPVARAVDPVRTATELVRENRRITAKQILAASQPTAARHGVHMHRVLEAVEWLGRGTEHEVFDQVDLQRWFSANTYRHRWPEVTELRVWREKSFAVRAGNDILQGRFDRVVVGLVNGHAQWAHVLEFKSGGRAHAATEEEYRVQLRIYAHALGKLLARSMHDVTIEASLLYIQPAQMVFIEVDSEAP